MASFAESAARDKPGLRTPMADDYSFLAEACADLHEASCFCIVKPWPLHAFWPLHELLDVLHAPWPLQDEEFSHFTLAWSAATAVPIVVIVNMPATAVARAIPVSFETVVAMLSYSVGWLLRIRIFAPNKLRRPERDSGRRLKERFAAKVLSATCSVRA